jgi:hypothetical protein
MVCRCTREQYGSRLHFWPMSDCFMRQGKNWRLVGYTDASCRNNKDFSSQRGLCIFLSHPHHREHSDGFGSLIEYESHKIKKNCQPTTGTIGCLYEVFRKMFVHVWIMDGFNWNCG